MKTKILKKTIEANQKDTKNIGRSSFSEHNKESTMGALLSKP